MTYREMALEGWPLSEVRRHRPGAPRKVVAALYREARKRVRVSEMRRLAAHESAEMSELRVEALCSPAFEGPIDSLRSNWGSRLPATAVSAASRIGLTGQSEKRTR